MKNLLLILALAASLIGCATPPPAPPQHTTLFRPGEYGSKYYRIPALVTTTQGTLLAVADRRIESQGDLPNA
ncbi:MAG TPA: glycoside hydrolase, partial [Candidatus Alistipes stercoravium]|nr:glycoside hydrolase [Candidatus Alistipes stercoravium]